MSGNDAWSTIEISGDQEASSFSIDLETSEAISTSLVASASAEGSKVSCTTPLDSETSTLFVL